MQGRSCDMLSGRNVETSPPLTLLRGQVPQKSWHRRCTCGAAALAQGRSSQMRRLAAAAPAAAAPQAHPETQCSHCARLHACSLSLRLHSHSWHSNAGHCSAVGRTPSGTCATAVQHAKSPVVRRRTRLAMAWSAEAVCSSCRANTRSKQASRLGLSFRFSCRVLAARKRPPIGSAAATMAAQAGRKAATPCLLSIVQPTCMASCSAWRTAQRHTSAEQTSTLLHILIKAMSKSESHTYVAQLAANGTCALL